MRRATGRQKLDIRGFFDEEARRYIRERYVLPTCDQFAYQSRRRLALDLVGAGPGRIVDIGAGPGVMTADLRARSYDVYSVDISLEMLRESRRTSEDRVAASRVVGGCLPELPFVSGAFDAAMCIGVLAYLENPLAGLMEIRRVLKRSGFAVLQASSAFSPSGRLHSLLRRWYRRAGESLGGSAYPHLDIRLRRFRLGSLCRSLESASLDVEAVAFYDFRPPVLQWVMPQTTLMATRWLQRFEDSRWLGVLSEGLILKVRAL